MKIGTVIAALFLLACSPAQSGESGERQKLMLVNVASADSANCSYKAEAISVDLERPSVDDLKILTAAETIMVAGKGDTAYQCVTRAVDRLNDLGIQAIYEEKAWKNLSSVDLGRKKLEADIAGESGHPEARPFDRERNARADLDTALEKARTSGNNVIAVLGANWCHDSRALSGWFASPRFARMLASKFEVVYVDVGYKDRNIDIAQSFDIAEIKGTPTVLVISPEAQLLNSETAPTWRNAASRKEDSVFQYFESFQIEE